MEQIVAKDASSESIETIAPFMTIIGVDTTFLAVQAAIRQIVSCCQLLSTTVPNPHPGQPDKDSLFFLELVTVSVHQHRICFVFGL